MDLHAWYHIVLEATLPAREEPSIPRYLFPPVDSETGLPQCTRKRCRGPQVPHLIKACSLTAARCAHGKFATYQKSSCIILHFLQARCGARFGGMDSRGNENAKALDRLGLGHGRRMRCGEEELVFRLGHLQPAEPAQKYLYISCVAIGLLAYLITIVDMIAVQDARPQS